MYCRGNMASKIQFITLIKAPVTGEAPVVGCSSRLMRWYFVKLCLSVLPQALIHRNGNRCRQMHTHTSWHLRGHIHSCMHTHTHGHHERIPSRRGGMSTPTWKNYSFAIQLTPTRLLQFYMPRKNILFAWFFFSIHTESIAKQGIYGAI